MSDRKLKVVYIAGWGGSGTTIIDNILGQIDGWRSTGELHALWSGLRDGRYPCGCGVWIGHCPFWSSVIESGFESAGSGEPDPALIVRWQDHAARMRRFPALMRSVRRANPSSEVAAYADVSYRLYWAIAAVSGARVVVDSSKVPSYAALLRLMPDIEPYVVHLVRDPRAVAHSWKRRGSRNAVDSTGHWMLWNLAVNAVRGSLDPARSIVVRYEDFASRPSTVIAEIVRMAGERDEVPLPFVDEHTARLAPNHTVSGNESRFRSGDVQVELDRKWERESRPISRAASTMLSLPLLGSFGYPVLAHRRDGETDPKTRELT
jgi:hypothetical protein